MKKFYLIAIAALLLGLGSVAAQSDNSADIRMQIDSLQQRLAKLEKRATTWDKIKQHFKLSGFIQAQYIWQDGAVARDNSGLSLTKGESTFNLRRARLSLTGDIFRGKKAGSADYRLQVDFAGSPKIVDLWIRYRPFNELGIQVGQFKNPLSIENSEYSPPSKLEFIDNALIVQRFIHCGSNDMTGVSAAGRELGAQLYGGFIKNEKQNFNYITYNLAVFNGNGINTKDNNKSKDIVGRIMVNPIKNLTLAAYYQWGESDLSSLNKSWAPLILDNVANPKFTEIQRYGGGIAYNDKKAFARAEYIKAKTGSLTSDGAYVSAGYRFCGKGLVGARFEYFDEDNYADGCQFNYTIGVSYTPWKHMLLQLNYTLSQYHKLGYHNGNCIALMVTGIF